MLAVEREEVHRLQQDVGELGVGDAAGLEPALHRLARQHPVDREVLADVTQEVDGRQALGPVEVVDHRRGVVAVEGQERLDLPAYATDPLRDRPRVVEGALPRVPRVADHAGRPAHERVRRVAGVLQPLRGEDLHQVAQVQARRGRVEADVEPHAPRRERLAQGVEVRRVRDQAAPLEVVEEGGVEGHRAAFRPRAGSVPAAVEGCASGSGRAVQACLIGTPVPHRVPPTRPREQCRGPLPLS